MPTGHTNTTVVFRLTAQLARQACCFWQLKLLLHAVLHEPMGLLPFPMKSNFSLVITLMHTALIKTWATLLTNTHNNQEVLALPPWQQQVFQFPHVLYHLCSCTWSQVHRPSAAPSASFMSGSKNSHQTANNKVITTVWCRRVIKTWILPECAYEV